ncbi:hypothetical protein [uncultured Pontibacter sp.]|uniref:hypothetical protein n=1 Tax=uncultured Pontibacter sp. TaxID=453356 RepID=UPI0026288F0E|nr:hypothetical protein [uncultured Pontibacter sp.]
MKEFFLNRSLSFYFWSGLTLAICNFMNFGVAFAEAWYAGSYYSPSSFLLLSLSAVLALFFFWSLQAGRGKGGCFSGVTALLVVFNLLFNLLLLIFLV